MDWLAVDTTNCSVGRTLDAVGDRWTLLIVRELLNGVNRFADLQRHLKISAPVLTGRLRHLEQRDLVQRHTYQEAGARPRDEYHLTERGADLQTLVIALMEWGDRHVADSAGAAIVLHDKSTRHPVHLALVDPGLHTVKPSAIEWQPGPAHRTRPT